MARRGPLSAAKRKREADKREKRQAKQERRARRAEERRARRAGELNQAGEVAESETMTREDNEAAPSSMTGT